MQRIINNKDTEIEKSGDKTKKRNKSKEEKKWILIVLLKNIQFHQRFFWNCGFLIERQVNESNENHMSGGFVKLTLYRMVRSSEWKR